MTMRSTKKVSFMIPIFILSGAITKFAQSSEEKIEQTVIAKSCFVQNSSLKFKELGRMEDFVLIQAKMTDLEAAREQTTIRTCGFYRDITIEWQEFLQKNHKNFSTQSINSYATYLLSNELISLKQNNLNSKINTKAFEIKYQDEVERLLNSFVPQRLWNDLQTLTSFPNRYPLSDNGVKAAEWFKTQVENIAQSANRSDINVQFIKTGSPYKQPSVIVTIPGAQPDLEGVLLGGHMDTVDGNRPGADDDGSGSIGVLETFRTIVNSGLRFKRTMYFAWYAAEEDGLVGSQQVVKFFKKEKIPLVGVLQLDMTGTQEKPKNKVWIIDDYVDSSLSKFVAKLAVNYAKTEVAYTSCDYACSDHASWTAKGYRAAMPFESKVEDGNPHIHTVNDDMSHISLDHMSRFAIIAISFMGELSDPLPIN